MRSLYSRLVTAAMVGTMCLTIAAVASAQSTRATVFGEIERITIVNPSDHWSAGTMVVAGQTIIIPRNLLFDLPANRLTLQELFGGAPPTCLSAGQTGLARTDTCLAGRPGGYATINGNRLACGDLVAGDAFIQKGTEIVTGNVTAINFTDGFLTINGNLMLRLNDPIGRHTIQRGLGCALGNNCSPDPRFTLDPDNYTARFSTGYPVCIPSTQVFPPLRTAGADTAGGGDPFCPATNRAATPAPTPGGFTVPDSTRYAPIKVGDNLTALGNIEIVNGVRFFSAWSVAVSEALLTRNDPSQPDYLFPAEAVWDLSGFPRHRARFQLIAFGTLAPLNYDVFAMRVDPTTNQSIEDPLASTVGNPGFIFPAVSPPGSISRVRLEVDFVAGVKAGGQFDSPCNVLANAGLTPSGGCAIGNLALELGVINPPSREIVVRTRRTVPLLATAITRDIQGRQANNASGPDGRYLMPLGIGLGGLEAPAPDEFALDNMQIPNVFAEPWMFDRRLSPNGCVVDLGGCEGTPQPLDPFPFSGLDPRTLVADNPAPNRSLTFFTAGGGGGLTPHLATWPPAGPTCGAVPVGGGIGGVGTNPAPIAVSDAFTAISGAPVVFSGATLLANDLGVGLTIGAVGPVSLGGGVVTSNGAGTFTFTPAAGFAGVDTFSYSIIDSTGAIAVGTVTVVVPDTTLPVATINVPAPGAVVQAVTTITASATDNVGIVGLSILVDGVPLGAESPTSPLSRTWDTTTVPNGLHRLTAVARDAAGNIGTSLVVTVNVTNPVADVTPPTVAITAPANGATVAGVVAVNATAADNVGVAGVQFLLDGAPLGAEDTAAPFSVNWTTTASANGAHVLTARARDAAGNTATSATVTVNVNNAVADVTPPTVSITTPVNGATVASIVAVSATAADNVGVAGVQFLLDGANLGAEDTAAPFTVNWTTTASTNGAHVLTARARDAAGNTTTSAAVTVNVNNAPAAAGPSVDVTISSDGAGTRTTPAFSTAAANEQLVAFAASDGPPAVNSQTLTISGAGLTWTRVQRAATRFGVAEIWTARAATALTNVTVTSTQAAAGFHQSLTVVSFTGVSAIGASAAGGAATGAPTVSLVAQATGSVVYGVGNDWDGAIARTIPAGQTLVHSFVDTAVGDTFWVQAASAATTAGATVTLNATAPTTDQWNFAVVELRP